MTTTISPPSRSSTPTVPLVAFERHPSSYRHWTVTYDAPVATVTMLVDPGGGLRPDYELKSNSYDLNVDIELYDIVQRLRFEHPEIKVVVLTGGLGNVFCAGANIGMLATSSHNHKVNFCKFTNETRNAIEQATAESQQVWLAALNGAAAGGGYELALACEEIILIDDRSSTVSLPEVPLLGVLPGTGGLTRLVDKRHVRRDVADVFTTKAEGVRGPQAVDWGLIDATVARSMWDDYLAERSSLQAAESDRPGGAGVELFPLELEFDSCSDAAAADSISGAHIRVRIDRAVGAAHLTVHGPPAGGDPVPATPGEAREAGAGWWPLAAVRELDAVMLHLRFNEPSIGTWVVRTEGDPVAVGAVDEFVNTHRDDWFVREVHLYWARTLKRLDLSARSVLALVEPGSCFTGLLAELALAADRTLMLDGQFEDDDEPARPAALTLTATNLGLVPMANGLSRLATRFWGHDDSLAAAAAAAEAQTPLEAAEAKRLGLVTDTPDDLDWDDEVRLFIEERAAFSPDALIGLEANLRFAGPETTETKIFARLTAWQNWIFQRPNASGPDGALQRYGTGIRPSYDPNRV